MLGLVLVKYVRIQLSLLYYLFNRDNKTTNRSNAGKRTMKRKPAMMTIPHESQCSSRRRTSPSNPPESPPPMFGPSPGVARSSLGATVRQVPAPTKQEHPPQHKVIGLTPEDRMPSEKELVQNQSQRFSESLNAWYLRFNELIEYRETHGDCLVPQKYKPNPKLGYWVNKQRMDKRDFDEGRKTSLTQEKLQKLNKIGFQWAKHKGTSGWDQKYIELSAYYREHGHSNIPTKCPENTALGRWVSTQRSEYKKFLDGQSKYMTTKRVEQLNAIKFKWDASFDSTWRGKRLAPTFADLLGEVDNSTQGTVE